MINQWWIHVIWRWFPCFKHGMCFHEWNWDDLRISDSKKCLGCWNQDATDLGICDKHPVGLGSRYVNIFQTFWDPVEPCWQHFILGDVLTILPVSPRGSARWPTGTGTWHHRPTRQLAVVLSTYGFFSHGFVNEAYIYIYIYQGYLKILIVSWFSCAMIR